MIARLAWMLALGLDSAELEWLNPAGNNAVGRP